MWRLVCKVATELPALLDKNDIQVKVRISKLTGTASVDDTMWEYYTFIDKYEGILAF